MSRIRTAFEQRGWSQTVSALDIGQNSPAPVGDWAPGMAYRLGGGGSNVDQALQLSAVFACFRIISEAIATLPFDAYRRVGSTRLEVRPLPPFMLFENRSRIDYLSQIVLSLLSDGNAFVFLVRDPLGEVIDTAVLDPCRVTVEADRSGTVYRVMGETLGPLDCMHIKGMSMPSALRGMSPISYAAQSIGLGLAAQQFGKSFFENGALPGAVISAPGDFGRDKAELFASTWNAGHQGIGNAHKVGVLTGGATLNQVSVSPEDSQFLQTRAFQVPDIARIFGVPPHLIADAEKSTSWGSGLAEQNMSFGQYTLRGWCERIEEGHTRIMPSTGRGDVFTKLNLDAVLRATLKERYESGAVGITTGFLTINEVRAYEDLPPVPWGNEPPAPAPALPPSGPPPVPLAGGLTPPATGAKP